MSAESEKNLWLWLSSVRPFPLPMPCAFLVILTFVNYLPTHAIYKRNSNFYKGKMGFIL